MQLVNPIYCNWQDAQKNGCKYVKVHNMLKINGVEYLGGTVHTMLPDMIEVGSFIGLAAMTQSDITIKDVNIKNWVDSRISKTGYTNGIDRR